MKRYLFGLVALTVFAGHALLGQAPVAAPPGPGSIGSVPTKPVCVPEHYTKKKDKVVYSSGCEPICPCFFHGLFKHCKCASGQCDRPYLRRYLIKKKETCEQDAVKCVPKEVPACEQGHCRGGSCPTVGASPVPVAAPSVPTMPQANPAAVPR